MEMKTTAAARPTEAVPTGIATLDRLIGGLPRGAITAIRASERIGAAELIINMLKHIGSSEAPSLLLSYHSTWNYRLCIELMGSMQRDIDGTSDGASIHYIDLACFGEETLRRLIRLYADTDGMRTSIIGIVFSGLFDSQKKIAADILRVAAMDACVPAVIWVDHWSPSVVDTSRIAMELRRSNFYDRDGSFIVDVHVAKNAYGDTGVVPLWYHADSMVIRELSKDDLDVFYESERAKEGNDENRAAD